MPIWRPSWLCRCGRSNPAVGMAAGATPRGGSAVSILIAIVGLGFLVMIHEAGHFFRARAVGMRPRRFYVGFPPALAKTTRNGIEYGIGRSEERRVGEE